MSNEREDLEKIFKKTKREHKDVEHELLMKKSGLEDKIPDLNDYKLQTRKKLNQKLKSWKRDKDVNQKRSQY